MRRHCTPQSFSSRSSSSAKEDDEAHEGVEALLEAYYMHVDFSHKLLSELRDAIEDTEDLAEISLDSQRNQLIKIDLIISNGMLSVGIFSMVSGTFGMNLRTGWESEPQVNPRL
jgi:magnesium transporter